MPELPEVTTITNQLEKEIVGSVIKDVQAVGSYKIQPGLREKAIGQKVRSVKRIAKNIVVELGDLDSSLPLRREASRRAQDDGKEQRGQDDGTVAQDDEGKGFSILNSQLSIVIHLAMTGRLVLRPLEYKPDPWTRLIFKLQHQSSESRVKNQELRFCDSRMFGFVQLMNQDELEQYSSKYGPDALSENLTPEVFLSQLRKKKTEVKRALLEQELIAGAGNIYVNDSLWMAGIHPQTSTQQVTEEQSTRLLTALKSILKESIEHRGSTLGDKMYIDVYGNEGTHQNYFRVFGRDGQACPRCSTKIEIMEIGGRGTFFCPRCQNIRLADNSKNNQPSLV